MRRLAARCGVTAMSLYRHVRTKEELLAVLADRLLDDLEVPVVPGQSPEDQVGAVFRALYRMWRAHPEFGLIAASQPVDGKVAHRWMEVVLGALGRAGLDAAQSVDAYDALACYTAGFLQQHAGRKQDAVPEAERIARINDSSGEFSHVLAAADQLVNRSDEKYFDAGLRIVLRGVFDG